MAFCRRRERQNSGSDSWRFTRFAQLCHAAHRRLRVDRQRADAGRHLWRSVAVENVKTLDQTRGDSLASRNFAMQLIAGFALIGSVLTLVGIYGVLSLSRTSKLWIRLVAIHSLRATLPCSSSPASR